jgi:adenylosuccinate synthase
LENEADAKIGMISTGPDRDHTILMDEFAKELQTAATPGV